jgi:carboxylesterase
MTVDPGPFSLGPVGGRGPAVVCLHGLSGTPYEVRPPAEALAGHGFACVGPLLPGHGEPWERLAASPASAWIEAAENAFDRLQKTHERVYILGLSMGGLLALTLAVRRSVAGLLVLATPLRLRWLPRNAVPILARFVGSVRKKSGIADPEALARHPGTDRMPLRSVLNVMRLQEQVDRDLHRVKAPIHLIFSRKDPSVDPRDAERILKSVASSQRTIRYLERSLHVVTVDFDREEVARECVGFLQRLESSRGPSTRVDAKPTAP